MVQNMRELADEGDAVREDVGCGILYAVLRDSAYKIKKLAEALSVTRGVQQIRVSLMR